MTRYSYHTYFSPTSNSWYRRFGTGCIVRNGWWRIFVNYSVFSALSLLKLRVFFEEEMLYHPWSYGITIDENPIPLNRICVLSYLCLLLTKVLLETSFKSFQYNTKGRRLSDYSIKLILYFHYRSRYKEQCQNKKSMDLTNIQREVTFAPHITLNRKTVITV